MALHVYVCVGCVDEGHSEEGNRCAPQWDSAHYEGGTCVHVLASFPGSPSAHKVIRGIIACGGSLGTRLYIYMGGQY